MENNIRLLPESLANHIAAGEVAPSPSYVVKELLENAVDSGAKNIRLDISEGGRDLISVTDDGVGMSFQDARMAFERHATSKLASIDDLSNICTFGFRGEALAAISAVTQVEMKTRRDDEELGTEIIIHGGKLIEAEPCTTSKGTCIKAKNIFFNVPARRKFLEDPSKEERKILAEFDRIAYVNTDINFSLYSSSHMIRDLRAGSLLSRITDLTRKNLKQELIPIKFEGSDNGLFSFKGYIGTPSSAKKKKGYAYQYLFANGRYIEHKSFENQIKIAYKDILLPNQYPHYFIYFDVPPEDIDVNVHPTKIQVRFAQEYLIGEYLRRMIRETLSANATIPVIDFNNHVSLDDIPAYNPNKKIDFIDSNHTSNNGKSFSSKHLDRNDSSMDFDWDNLSKSFNQDSSLTLVDRGQNIFDSHIDDETLNQDIIGKVSSDYFIYNNYLVILLLKGITIVDIKSAYERILYDRYYNNIEDIRLSKSGVQHFIEPVKLDFQHQEIKTATKVISFLSNMGFEFSDFGGGTFSITATPCFISPENCLSLVKDLIDSLDGIDDVDDFASSYIAKFVAINESKSKIISSKREDIDDFISALFQSTDPQISPSGSIIYKVLKEKELIKLFS